LLTTIAVASAGGRVPIIVGCGAPATEGAMALARAAARNCASAVLCAPPPYSRPTQDGIVAHVRADRVPSRGACGGPAGDLYDVPGRTGVAIEDATVLRLVEAGLPRFSVVG